MSMIEESWPAVLEGVRTRLRKQQFDTWFRHVTPSALTQDVLELEVPNGFSRDWLANHYIDVIADAAAAVMGKRPEITFVVRDTVEEEMQASPQPPAAAADEQSMAAPARPNRSGWDTNEEDIQTRLNSQYTFNNFVVGPSNSLAHAAAIGVAESPGFAYNPLFMHGCVGLGKTHLIQGIAHSLLQRTPRPRLLYMSCETFMNQFIQAVQKGGLERFRYRYRQVDALLIDDIHFLAKGERTQEEFFHTFNTLYNAHKQIVMTCDRPPKEIPKIEERLISRFKWGMVVKVDVPEFETRVAIIRKKAHFRQMEMPDEVVAYIAEHIDTNIREIEGAIVRLCAVASLSGQKITLKTAQAALADSIQRERRTINIEDIQSSVITHFRVKLSDLQSKKRSKTIALPRHVCMYLARKLTSYSLEEIGGYFGGRDHSTVLHACENIQNRILEDPQQAATIQMLTEELRTQR